MDIEAVIRQVLNSEDGDNTAPASTLGPLIADALSDAGLAQLDGDQVADYIYDLGDRTGMGDGEAAEALTEAIEAGLAEEDEN